MLTILRPLGGRQGRAQPLWPWRRRWASSATSPPPPPTAAASPSAQTLDSWEVGMDGFAYRAIDSGSTEQPPTLAHGLEAVLFQPGKVIRLQNPVTCKFNFSPTLKHLHPPDKFNFARLRPHVPPAADPTLLSLAQRHHLPYMSSTSSFTELLAKVYLLMCRGRPVDVSYLSPALDGGTSGGTKAMSRINYKPVSCLLHWRGTGYAINKERFFPDLKGTIMSYMGQSLEKMLVEEPANFAKYLKSYTGPFDLKQHDAYHFGEAEGFLLRSQLDCMHPGLPKRTFDLKTRATLPIRNDPFSYADYRGYRLRYEEGLFQSYEREYHDLLRSKLLLNSLQARIGDMDGILIAHHNVEEIFGFQYVPLSQMEEHIFGSRRLAEESFALSMRLLRRVLDTILRPVWGRDARVVMSVNQSLITLHVEEVEVGADGLARGEPCTRPVRTYTLALTSRLDGRVVRVLRELPDGAAWTVAAQLQQLSETASLTLPNKAYLEAIARIKESECFGSSLDLGNKAFARSAMPRHLRRHLKPLPSKSASRAPNPAPVTAAAA